MFYIRLLSNFPEVLSYSVEIHHLSS